jgi:hypothetical protein
LQDNSTWYEYYYFESAWNEKYIVTRDSIINDTLYKVITSYIQEENNPIMEWLFREDTIEKKIYMKRYDDPELLMYDYSMQIQDTFWFPWDIWSDYNYTILDSITNNLSAYINTIGHYVNVSVGDRRVYYFSNPNSNRREFIWIEGIGSINGICNDYEYVDYNLLCHYNSIGELDLHLNIDETCYGPILNSIKATKINRLNIYPNPTTGIFTIECDNLNYVEIYSTTGQRLMNTRQNSIDLNYMPNGIYIIKISNGNSIYMEKLIKF